MPEAELIVLCDEAGNPTGTAEKLATHNANTPMHRAFSCYLFNQKGQILLTQRAAVKKVWPTVWTNSCCGHPAPGESDEAAISRRLDYELGMSAEQPVCILPTYHYKTPPYKGIIEHEFCPVYAARTSVEPAPNPDEVDDYRWVSWPEYIRLLEHDTTDEYSWWAKDQLKQLKDHPLLKSFYQ